MRICKWDVSGRKLFFYLNALKESLTIWGNVIPADCACQHTTGTALPGSAGDANTQLATPELALLIRRVPRLNSNADCNPLAVLCRAHDTASVGLGFIKYETGFSSKDSCEHQSSSLYKMTCRVSHHFQFNMVYLSRMMRLDSELIHGDPTNNKQFLLIQKVPFLFIYL